MGFKLNGWDYLTFLAVIAAGISILIILLWIAGLPGKIAISRKHPDAEAVKIMGYAGFLAVVPWINAFIWAFKPTDTVDIRRLPAEEARALEESIARLSGEDEAKRSKPPPHGKNPPGDNTKE
ncbi:DUF3302 domain-containing protein [Microbulbifer hainanensis]|uniref:DUF3302 domain-containing protein n=1 Tax=Microbulbifer hainanensis TaxID=2735675 RepID=UPI001D03599A|nr:DUF3302 domain-containing protein [Microbulbifer hainanensis]